MDITKTTIKAVLDYESAFISIFAPGVAIIDLALGRGLFSKPPTDIYQFILLLFWAGVLSAPFTILVDFVLALQLHAKKYGLTMPADVDYGDASIKFPLLFLLTAICLVLFRVSEPVFASAPTEWMGMSINYLRLVAAFIITIPVGYMLGALYRHLVFSLAKRLIE